MKTLPNKLYWFSHWFEKENFCHIADLPCWCLQTPHGREILWIHHYIVSEWENVQNEVIGEGMFPVFRVQGTYGYGGALHLKVHKK